MFSVFIGSVIAIRTIEKSYEGIEGSHQGYVEIQRFVDLDLDYIPYIALTCIHPEDVLCVFLP